MIILSKLADYGVIVAAHLAAAPERRVTAAAIAAATRLPPATVAKVLKILAHAGLVTATRGAGGGYRLARGAKTISLAEVVRHRRRYRADAMLGPYRRMRPYDLLSDPAALGRDQSGRRRGAVGDLA